MGLVEALGGMAGNGFAKVAASLGIAWRAHIG